MLKDFPNGVKSFTTRQAVVDIFFPEGRETCQYCRFCYAEKELDRFKCSLTPTNRIIPNPFVERAGFCPIVEIESEDD